MFFFGSIDFHTITVFILFIDAGNTYAFPFHELYERTHPVIVMNSIGVEVGGGAQGFFGVKKEIM